MRGLQRKTTPPCVLLGEKIVSFYCVLNRKKKQLKKHESRFLLCEKFQFETYLTLEHLEMAA